MGAALILDLTDDCGVVRHHYHDLVNDQGEKVLKCKVNRQQFQVVDVLGTSARGTMCWRSGEMSGEPPPSLQ